MLLAYIAVTILAASAYTYAAYLNFVRHESVIAVAKRLGVSQSAMFPFGSLLAAGALGLLIGFVVPVIGTAAAIGLILYFLGAIGAHVRVRDRFGAAALFLAMAVAALSISLAYRGPL